MHKLARLPGAVAAQERAIRLHLTQRAPSLVDVGLVHSLGNYADLTSSTRLQIQLLNLALYRLSVDFQVLLDFGSSTEPPMTTLLARSSPESDTWNGKFCDQLILWDDQGFGDTLQNLGWIAEASRRVGILRVWLRPALLPLVRACLPLPANCHLEAREPNLCPWGEGSAQIGFFYLPMVLNQWMQQPDSRAPYLNSPRARNTRSVNEKSGRRIGLVWSAGRHKAPQPERSARVRVPRQAFRIGSELEAAPSGHIGEFPTRRPRSTACQGLIQTGELERPLRSSDWLQTAEELASLDLLVALTHRLLILQVRLASPLCSCLLPRLIGAGARLVIKRFSMTP